MDRLGRALAAGERALARLQTRLDAADPGALPVQQALWLINLIDWLRRGPSPQGLRRALDPDDPAPAVRDTANDPLPKPVQRLHVLLDVLDRQPERRAAVASVLAGLLRHTDPTLLLADFGFTARPAFFSEFGERLKRKLLPASPETRDLAVLFGLFFPHAQDADWLSAIDGAALARVGNLLYTGADLRPEPSEDAADREPLSDAPKAEPSAEDGRTSPRDLLLRRWREDVLDALSFTVSQISATGFSPDLRTRMQVDADLRLDVEAPFRQLPGAFEILRAKLENRTAAPIRTAASDADAALPALSADDEDAPPEDIGPTLAMFRAVLDACRQRAESVTEHLDLYGSSVSMVFVLYQLRQRVDRAVALLDLLVSQRPELATARLVSELARINAQRRSLRALVRQNTGLLAEKMAERHAESGEQLITRDGAEYRAMLGSAAGGGAVLSLTTWIELAVLLLPATLFWSGLLMGLDYAVTFIIVQLLHWTVATKQPAMTAPAMADRLRELSKPGAVEQFVDEVANLTRSQAAGVFGNVALVIPCALLIGLAGTAWFGPQFMPVDRAEHELHKLSLLGPTPLFAALTGVLLFASSVVAGWMENGFVLHHLESAIEWNPRIRTFLGPERAARWARWWRRNIGVMSGNVALGLLMGLTPFFFLMFGVPLDVRHVTVSSGLLGAAISSLGPAVVNDPAFWWALAGIAVTGLLNVSVSFYFAFRLALRARDIKVLDRRAIYRGIGYRLLRHPLSFILPPRRKPQPPPEDAPV